MSKELQPFASSLVQCERDLSEFAALLAGKAELSEAQDILPFFSSHPQLIAMAGTWNTQMHRVDRICSEFDLFGNFRCDWAVGDTKSRVYSLIEFEDARPNSVFGGGQKYHEEWGRRFEHGFSQLVDWFWALDTNRSVPDFTRRFGTGNVQFLGMLVIGRRQFLLDHQEERLRWRQERVLINSHKITCITFDELHDFIGERLHYFRDLADSGDLS
jgi:hypothetical protein